MATTLNKLIYDIKNAIYGGITSDDNDLSDFQVKEWILRERAFLIKQDLDKNRQINESIVQDLGCVGLECVDQVECCSDIKSKKYISRTPILPIPINFNFATDSYNESFTFVGTLTGKPIELVSYQQIYYSQFNKWTGNERRAFYKNNRIYIINAEGLELISVRGIFEDPEEVINYSYCDGNPCYTFDSPFPISSYHEALLIPIIMQKYAPYFMNSNLTDVENNAKDNPETAIQQQAQ